MLKWQTGDLDGPLLLTDESLKRFHGGFCYDSSGSGKVIMSASPGIGVDFEKV